MRLSHASRGILPEAMQPPESAEGLVSDELTDRLEEHDLKRRKAFRGAQGLYPRAFVRGRAGPL